VGSGDYRSGLFGRTGKGCFLSSGPLIIPLVCYAVALGDPPKPPSVNRERHIQEVVQGPCLRTPGAAARARAPAHERTAVNGLFLLVESLPNRIVSLPTPQLASLRVAIAMQPLPRACCFLLCRRSKLTLLNALNYRAS
jgi:hypothetical protein